MDIKINYVNLLLPVISTAVYYVSHWWRLTAKPVDVWLLCTLCIFVYEHNHVLKYGDQFSLLPSFFSSFPCFPSPPCLPSPPSLSQLPFSLPSLPSLQFMSLCAESLNWSHFAVALLILGHSFIVWSELTLLCWYVVSRILIIQIHCFILRYLCTLLGKC